MRFYDIPVTGVYTLSRRLSARPRGCEVRPPRRAAAPAPLRPQQLRRTARHAFLNVALHSGAVDLEELAQELDCVTNDQLPEPYRSQQQVGEEDERRGRRGHALDHVKLELRIRAQARIRVEVRRKVFQLRRADFGQTMEEVVPQLDKAPGGSPERLDRERLLLLQPGQEFAASDFLRQVHDVPAVSGATPAFGHGRKPPAECIPCAALRLSKEILPPFSKKLRQPLLFHSEQCAEVAPGVFRLLECLVQLGDAPLRLFDGALQRAAFLLDDAQKLAYAAAQATVGGLLAQRAPGMLSQSFEFLEQLRPIALCSALLDALESADFVDSGDRTMQARFEDTPCECRGLRAFCFTHAIGFVQHDEEIPDLLGDDLDELEFLPRKRRICADHDQGRINVGNERVRGRGVAGENGAESRRVHQAHARGQQRTGEKDLQALHAFAVLRVLIFGDVLVNGFQRHLLPIRGAEPHPRRRTVPVPKDRRNRCDRHDAHGQHVASHERIEQGGLAALELADAGHVEEPFRGALGIRAGTLRDVGRFEFRGEAGDAAQRGFSARARQIFSNAVKGSAHGEG